MKVLYEKINRLYESDTEFGDIDDIQLSGDVAKDFETVVNILKDDSYIELIDDLNGITDDPKLYNLLAYGFGKGKLADVKMSASAINLPVVQLLPTQNEIGLPNSINSTFKMSDVSVFYKDPVMIKAPIITYRKTFIIDGHHRWSQIYMMNPKAKVKAINFNYQEASPIRMLRNMQGAIAVANKDVKSSAGSVENIYDMSKDQILNYIQTNITPQFIEAVIKEGKAKDKDGVINMILTNAMELKNSNPPIANAPDREYMPQTDENSVQLAVDGQTNI